MMRSVFVLTLIAITVNAKWVAKKQQELLHFDDYVVFPPTHEHNVRGNVVDNILDAVVKRDRSLVGINNLNTDATVYGNLVTLYTQHAVVGECVRVPVFFQYFQHPCTPENAKKFSKYEIKARLYGKKLKILSVKELD